MIEFVPNRYIDGIAVLDKESMVEQLRAKDMVPSRLYPQVLDPIYEPLLLPSLDYMQLRIYLPSNPDLPPPESTDERGSLCTFNLEYPANSPNVLYGHGGSTRNDWQFLNGMSVQDAVDKLRSAGIEVQGILSCNPGGCHIGEKDILYNTRDAKDGSMVEWELRGEEFTIGLSFDCKDTKVYMPFSKVRELIENPSRYLTCIGDSRYGDFLDVALAYFYEHFFDFEPEEEIKRDPLHQRMAGLLQREVLVISEMTELDKAIMRIAQRR